MITINFANIIIISVLVLMLLLSFLFLKGVYKHKRKIVRLRRKPIIRTHVKQYRNDLCRCGSGKKYKYCCMK